MQFSKFLTSTLCALALALPACGGDAKKVDAGKTATKAPPKPEPKKTDDVAKPEPKPEDTTPPPDPNAEKVKTAATLAKEISTDPEHADDILARHGLDRDALDTMMYEIASDPQLTQAYMEARKAV